MNNVSSKWFDQKFYNFNDTPARVNLLSKSIQVSVHTRQLNSCSYGQSKCSHSCCKYGEKKNHMFDVHRFVSSPALFLCSSKTCCAEPGPSIAAKQSKS
jgi:hypothetical protein